jgi:hypothetical protein
MVGGTFLRLRHPENLRKLDSVVTIVQICNEAEQLTKLPHFPTKRRDVLLENFPQLSAMI